MNKIIKTAAAAAALSAFATMASAVTTVVSTGERQFFPSESLLASERILTAPDGFVQFDFAAGEDLSIAEFDLAAVGNSGGADIDKIIVSFGSSDGESTLLTTSGMTGSTALGGGTLAGFSVSEGDTWSILFRVADGQSLTRNVGVQVSFSPEAIAPVPLPAAGGLLLAAVAAGGVVGRRKKKAD